MMAAILNSANWNQTLPSWIQTPCFLLSDSLKNTLSPFCLWLKLIQSDSNSFILTQLDDGSNLEFCQFAFSHLSFFSQTHSHLPRLLPTICTKLHSFILTQLDDGSHLELCHLQYSHFAQKRSSLIHSDSTWWWQPSCILPSWILPSWIQPFCTKLWIQLSQFDSKSFILTQLDDDSHLGFSQFVQKKLHSLFLTQHDDGSHIEFCYLGFIHFTQKKFTHSFWLNLMMAAILNSANLNSTILDSAIIVFPLKLTHTCQDWFPPFAQKTFTHSFWLKLMMAAILNSAMLDLDPAILDSDTLFSSLRFTQNHPLSILTLTQTHSFSLNLIMAAILNSANLHSAILVFPLKLTHTCQDWFPPFAQK